MPAKKTLPAMTRTATLLVLLLLAAPALPMAGAEEGDPSPGGAAPGGPNPGADAPSPLEALQDEQLEAEAAQPDPIAYLRSFHKWLVLHEKPPIRTRLDSALHDVWNAALRPRAGRMSRRIEKLMQRKYWLPEEGAPTHVKPEAWSRFVREIAGLMTELHGAYRQYDSARVLVKRGVPVQRLRPAGSYYGYGHSVGMWRRALNRRLAIHTRRGWGGRRRVTTGRVTLGAHAPGTDPGRGALAPGAGISGRGPVSAGTGSTRGGIVRRRAELYSYWNLLHRYRRGWDWRITHCVGCEQRRLAAQQARADFIAERQRLFDTTRDTLQQQMLALQILVAALQAQTEAVLVVQFDAIPVTDSAESRELQADIDTALYELGDKRLAGERYVGDSSSQLGHLLRGWVRSFKSTQRLLEKATPPDAE